MQPFEREERDTFPCPPPIHNAVDPITVKDVLTASGGFIVFLLTVAWLFYC
jgi:hypothetical protein